MIIMEINIMKQLQKKIKPILLCCGLLMIISGVITSILSFRIKTSVDEVENELEELP